MIINNKKYTVGELLKIVADHEKSQRGNDYVSPCLIDSHEVIACDGYDAEGYALSFGQLRRCDVAEAQYIVIAGYGKTIATLKIS